MKIESNNRLTPLHYAVAWDNYDIITYLLKNNAIINFQDIYGNTPLMNTIKDDQLKSFNMLIKYPYNKF